MVVVMVTQQLFMLLPVAVVIAWRLVRSTSDNQLHSTDRGSTKITDSLSFVSIGIIHVLKSGHPSGRRAPPLQQCGNEQTNRRNLFGKNA